MSTGAVLHKRFVKSYAGNNNNKYWYISVFPDGSLKTEWGRIGSSHQEKTFQYGNVDSAKIQFEKKIKSKLKGKKNEPPYVEVDVVDVQDINVSTGQSNTSLNDVILRVMGNSNTTVEDLLRYLIQENKHSILESTTLTYNDTTGLFSTPVGIVSRNTVSQARTLLSTLLDYIKNETVETPEHIANIEKYLMFIPQYVSNMRNVGSLFSTEDQIKQQASVLDSLDSSLDVVEKAQSGDSATDNDADVEYDSGIQTELLPLDDQKEYDRVNKLFLSTVKSQHRSKDLKLQRIFRVSIDAMNTAFEAKKHLGNIQQLWHGTRVGNVLSIMCKGYYIPPSSASYVTGRLFGNGCYFANSSTKSLNYAEGYWGGGSRSRSMYMFLNDVVLGKYYTPSGTYEHLPKSGYDSTWAIAGKSGVYNDEIIVYNTSQCRPILLCEFK